MIDAERPFTPARLAMSEPSTLRLANGRSVRVLHVPDAQKAAAFVRIAAGSHDAPTEYPGLAHFLEHLLFLGSGGFSAEDGLLSYVRACGGEVNASTRERHTEFFFEVPASKLADGLLRLFDMLARPLLDVAAQMREREVLQAEFVARGQDRDTLCDVAVGQALAHGHPCSAFHAGNRETLNVEQAEFQAALQDFHQRFYHTGQMQLVLVGPQSLGELEQLAQIRSAVLRSAPAMPQSVAAPLHPLRLNAMRLHVPAGSAQLTLCFALTSVCEGYSQAVDFLETWLTHEGPDGLLDTLRSRGWCVAVRVRRVYQYAEQALLSLDFDLSETTGESDRASIRDAVLDWLRFFAGHDDWLTWRQQYERISALRLDAAAPAQLARHLARDGSDVRTTPEALRTLLRQLRADNLVEVHSSAEPVPFRREVGFTLHLAELFPLKTQAEHWAWRMPPENRLLQPSASLMEAHYPDGGSGLTTLPGPSQSKAQRGACLFVRWQFGEGAPEALFAVLNVAIGPLLQQAEQAGVKVRFENNEGGWELMVSGRAELFAPVLTEMAEILEQPADAAWGQGLRRHQEACARVSNEPLVRQLWQRLPEMLNPQPGSGVDAPATANALAGFWQSATRQALAVAVQDQLLGQLSRVVAGLPGRAMVSASVNEPERLFVQPRSGWFWKQALPCAEETALVLFCPVPVAEPQVEVAWRLIGRLLESPFFQRLRTELQLGYAVFCGFRHIARRPGLLFAVQSPHANAAKIVQHLDEFLHAQRERIATLTEEQMRPLRDSLRDEVQNQSADLTEYAAQVWRAQLTGQPCVTVADVDKVGLELVAASYQMLLDATAGCYMLANASCPVGRWKS